MVKKTKIHIFFFLMVFILAFGCGSAEKGSGGGENTGSIALSVNWQGAATNSPDANLNMAAALDCAASSVATVSAYVYDSSNTLLSSGGPWSCSAHSGTISNVPAGISRRMLIVGSDSNGVVRYCGEQTNIIVSSGQTTSVSITAYDFTPSGVSAAGGNGQATISWTAVTGATSYNIYWSTTTGVTKTNGTKITGVTSPYTQTGLTNGTAYYYVVTAVNSYGESSESAQVSASPTTAILPTVLTTDKSDTGQSSYTTASISPSANKLIIVAVLNKALGFNTQTPTISGNGLTYVQIISAVASSDYDRVTLFRAMGASPSPGVITIDIAGSTQYCYWSVIEFDNINTSGINGSGAIVQSGSQVDVGGTGSTVTLSAFGNANNTVFGAVKSATTITPGSGFTELGEASGAINFETEWKGSEDTTVDWSWANNTGYVVGVAIEIK